MIPFITTCLPFVLLLSTSSHVQACSPIPGELIGPFFAPFPGVIGNNPHLWTTTSSNDPSSILLGTITVFDDVDTTMLNVTISMTDGSVTSGWPDGAVPTVPPALLPDPTGGYLLSVVNETNVVTFIKDAASVSMTLELPELFTILDPTTQVYFLVDDDDTGYMFYMGTLVCDTPEAQMADERCATACTGCQFQDNFAATIDLLTGETIRNGYKFDSSYGVFLIMPGPMNSVHTVWNSLQIANVGALDSCGGTGYLRYDPGDGIVQQMMSFDPGFLYATDTTDAEEDDGYTAYKIDETMEQVSEQRFVSNFSIRKFSMLSGETISTIPLDTAAIWALSGLEMPVANGTTTTPAPADPSIPIVVPFSVRAPTPAPAIGTSPVVVSMPSTPVPVVIAAITTDMPVLAGGNTTDLSPAPISIANPAFNTTTMVPTAAPIIPSQLVDNNSNSSTPSSAPINTNTTSVVLPEFCSANEVCNGLALTGVCCPTIDLVMLQCCQMGNVVLNCPANPRCAEANLDGACCPTPEGMYLDCCEVVPDDCGAENTSCEIIKVADYKALKSSATGGLVTSSSFFWLLQIVMVGWKIMAAF